MAPQSKSRLAAPVIEADRATLHAIQELDNYQTVNPAHSMAELLNLELTLAQAELAQARARRALDIARSQTMDAARDFHEAILGAKTQVLAQYGPDSMAVQAVGLKRRSERKRPTRRAGEGPAAD